VADRDNSVSVGNTATDSTRQIANIADGTEDHDAINVQQLRSAEHRSSAGTAAAMAVGGLAQPTAVGKSVTTAALSSFNGESALAIGISTVSENGRWIHKLAGSFNSRGQGGAVVSTGFQW
jgi:autotransporter adhesin